MASPETNTAGLHKVADFPLNQLHRVVSSVKQMTHQLEFYVYQGKFCLYVLPENTEAAKVLLGIPMRSAPASYE